MINNNSLDQRINEAAKILIDNGWSYLDCIRVLKSATPEISIRGTETGRSPSTVPVWGGTCFTPTDGGTEFNPITTVSNRTSEYVTISPDNIRKGL